MHVCEKYSHCARKDKSRNRKRVGKAEKRARMISLWLVVWQFMKLDSSIHVACVPVSMEGVIALLKGAK